MNPRLLEIEARKREIRALLEGTGEVDLAALQAELRALDTEKAGIEAAEQRKAIAAGIQAGAIPGTQIAKPAEQRAEVDKYDTMEYRKGFMQFCQTGVMPTEQRIDAFTSTTEAAAVIPTTIMNEIIKEMKAYGQVFNRTRKLNVKGGVNFPILSLKPVATRISESVVSDRKQINVSTSVSFSYKGLECKVATSLLAEAVTIPEFEAQIVPLIAEAMVKQMEIETISGNGATEMLGITQDARVPAGQIVTLSSAEFKDWGAWKKKIFGVIPLAYRAGGSFLMAAGTFEGYIDGMQDANGQPMARVNYGIADAPQERFGGREVILVEDDVVKPYDTAAVTDVVAIYCKLSDYGINSNMQMSMYRWLDHDLNQWVDKAILINDGKLIDARGVVIVKKGA
jgi:HK97 family phage major capsid protein